MNGKQGGEALSFSRTIRSYNSLPRHLPSSYSVPYGYKIDLDFVRFCDSYYDNRDSQRPASRLRRTKKSHKKSYNTLLGLHKEKADKPKSISPPAQAPAHFFPPSRTQTDNKLATDLESSLGQVMSDFEETFQRSRVRQENHAYLSDGGEYRPNGRRYHSLPRPATLRSWRTVEQDLPRASSNSSLSDSSDGAGNGLGRSSDLAREMAETISSLQKLSRMEDGPELRPGHRRSEVTTHVTSEGTPGSGREQTDSRLVGRKECRMETRVTVSSNSQRQAEDTHKLSVLREEKRSMEEQLTRSRPRREPQGDPPERTTQHTVSLRSRSLSPAQDPSSPGRRVLQDATTSCRVLTRDIGVDGCPERLDATPRSVHVLTDLNAGQENQGRRKISLGSILSGHGGNRTIGVNTRRSELTVGGTHVETVAGDDSVQEILERERRRPPGVERGSQTRAAAAVSAETSTDRPPTTRDAGASTELGLDELRQMCDLRDQLDELRELQRSTRASSSETRDTFTQIKEYELGVNYVRGAFSFVKSVNCSSQTEPPPLPAPLRSAGAQTEPEPEPWRPSTRAFAAQVHPAMTSVGVQCLEEDSRGVEARPERRDVAVTAEYRRLTRSVATATDAAPDGGSAVPRVKTTMTEVTPLRSVASGEHLVNRHQGCQTAPSPAPAAAAAAPAPAAPPVSSRHQATQTLAAPPSTPPVTPADRESPLPPLSRSSSGSKIPRRMATPPTARKAAPAAPAAPTPPAMESGPTTVLESARLVSGAGQVSDAEPKQRQFGRRDTFVAPRDTESQRQELGQGDATDQVEPSPEMRAALKVLNDSLSAPGAGKGSSAVAQARALVQAEWFKVAGSRDADPLVVEDYLDVLEGMSLDLLKTVVNMADNNSNTVMHYAVSHGNFDVVSVLLDSKVVDVQRQNNAGYTCIMLLSLAHITSETHRQVVRRLFQNGDVNVRAKQHGQTALMLAVSHGRLDMVNLLLEAGADINIQDEDGSTSLMCASEHGHAAIVRVLLAHPECDTQLTDNDGCTALQVAMEAGHRDVGLLLYAHSNFSRGSSPYGSLRLKKGGSRTPGGRASATPPRGATPTGTPGLGKRSLSSLH
ncbi:KN motif and ankyrin repeat domain-containing protein 1 [Amphibalanus amphitrite]|uniref:KN motif and ankyrin repeat domain-containing protein 1 n=1 Tax=Amphibalanus amphitrite TaxID=1232801 RepID=A0A6A4VAT8_AMPAM|nr:KN motif and ankyrin repeat domain-containing protein 1 [Amphibalanus amphitrite]